MDTTLAMTHNADMKSVTRNQRRRAYLVNVLDRDELFAFATLEPEIKAGWATACVGLTFDYNNRAGPSDALAERAPDNDFAAAVSRWSWSTFVLHLTIA